MDQGAIRTLTFRKIFVPKMIRNVEAGLWYSPSNCYCNQLKRETVTVPIIHNNTRK